MRTSIAVFAACAWFGASAAEAQVDEQKLRLMRESMSYTDVIDAADGDDPFDLNAHLGYTRSQDKGTIEREYTDGGSRKRGKVADSERTTSQLMVGLDIGLYKDVMAFIRLPLILSDARSLSRPDGTSSGAVTTLLTDPNDVGGQSSPLFNVPFKSPTRAGFDYIGIGGAWALLNQQRDPWLPTWVIMIEGRRAIGDPLKPCKDEKGDTQCGADFPQDLDGDGRPDGTFNSQFSGKKAGSSSGLSGISIETRFSRRYRYAEPYGGIGALIQWASTANKYFNPAGKLEGILNSLPSQQVTATLGTALIPWENRARFQRFALDLRLNATYLSQGHDYTALYDALGTSSHAELARANYEGVKGVDDPNAGGLKACSGNNQTNCFVGEKVPFYGLTDVQARLKYGMRIGLEIQAARYVRFGFGTGLNWLTSYALTAADSCNPNVTDANRRESYRGSTCSAGGNSAGIVNPAHRPTIDLPGRRFYMTGEFILDLYATATAQF